MSEENDQRDAADVQIDAGLEKLRIAQRIEKLATHEERISELERLLNEALGRIQYVEDYYCEDCNCER